MIQLRPKRLPSVWRLSCESNRSGSQSRRAPGSREKRPCLAETMRTRNRNPGRTRLLLSLVLAGSFCCTVTIGDDDVFRSDLYALTAVACLRASHTAIPADERQTNAVLCVLGLELIREAED